MLCSASTTTPGAEQDPSLLFLQYKSITVESCYSAWIHLQRPCNM